MAGDADFLHRLRRDTLIACGVLTVSALAVWPARPLIALGVLGGGGLIGVSYWAISAAVDRAHGAPGRGAALVKFVTRHGILALAAYVMMVRLHLDPIGMLVGVSSFGVAAAAEAVRTVTAARTRKP